MLTIKTFEVIFHIRLEDNFFDKTKNKEKICAELRFMRRGTIFQIL